MDIVTQLFGSLAQKIHPVQGMDVWANPCKQYIMQTVCLKQVVGMQAPEVPVLSIPIVQWWE